MTVQLTELENLLLSYISYFDIKGNLEDLYHAGELTIGDLVANNADIDKTLNDFRSKFSNDEDFQKFSSLVHMLGEKNSVYSSWKIVDYENHNTTSGFVAYTFEPEPGQAIVTFRGSEAMTDPKHFNTDWRNNLDTLTSILTQQRQEAIDYMNRVGSGYVFAYQPQKIDYQSIFVNGHSLGGNLALSATVGATKAVRDKIVSTVTFNAPGFNHLFIDNYSDEINEMKAKIKEFQNENDFVSSIMWNLTDPIIVPSKTKAVEGLLAGFDAINIDNHFLDFMATNGGNLIRSPKQEKNVVCTLVNNMTKGLVDYVPAFALDGLVDSALFAVNLFIDFPNFAVQSLLNIVTNPLPAAITFVETGISVACLLALGYINTAPELFLIREPLKFLLSMVVRGVNVVVEGLKKVAAFVMDAVNQLAHSMFDAVSNFFSGIAQALNWGKAPTTVQITDIQVDLDRLRNIAFRLQGVQNKIVYVDDRLDQLFNNANLLEKIQVWYNDLWVGYDNDLARCIDYLNQAADRLEQCEWKLLGAAYRF